MCVHVCVFLKCGLVENFMNLMGKGNKNPCHDKAEPGLGVPSTHKAPLEKDSSHPGSSKAPR